MFDLHIEGRVIVHAMSNPRDISTRIYVKDLEAESGVFHITPTHD